MKLPKQPLQIEGSRKALAPYNFVELPEKVVTVSAEQLPDQDQFHTKRHTGLIECQMITESPVYVRAARTLEQVEKKIASKDVPEFFYVRDINKPVIPGSTLRGMLRSLIEIASFGKISEVAEKRLVYRAVGDTTSHGARYRDLVMLNEGKHWDQDSREESHYYIPLTRAGYMRKRGSERGSDWVIQPAQNIGGTTFARIRIDERFFSRLTRIPDCKNACRIYVKVGPYEYLKVKEGFLQVKGTRVTEASATEDDPSYIAGTLARSGYMFSKKTEAVVYPPDEKAEPLELGDELIDAYRDQISKEQENILGKQGVLIDGQPVFYTLNEKDEKKVEFFGHCRMLRLPYTKTPRDYVPEALRRESDIDLAEAIFGFTKQLKDSEERKVKPKEKRYAGRVMVSDARLVIGQENVWLSLNRSITPRILASPKPTTFQHYLVQEDPNKTQLADYASETVIRGSKLYWHKGAIGLSDTESKGEVKEKQATKIKPLRAGVQFQFKVHFENLSQEELGALMWVLQIASDAQYRLKVGMGKPLGMGAIKIVSQLRLTDCKERYVDLLGDEDWIKGEKSEADTEKTKQEAVGAFEAFVLEGLDQKTAKQLTDLERIQQLLAMLSWPGPDREQTRYMEIERPDSKAKRGKRNEYKERPVLPSPLALVKVKRGSQESKAPTKQADGKALEPAEGLKRGMVKKFGLGPKASFGFIKPNDGSAEIFFHISQLQDKQDWIDVGTPVTYQERKGERGMEAIEIRIADR